MQHHDIGQQQQQSSQQHPQLPASDRARSSWQSLPPPVPGTAPVPTVLAPAPGPAVAIMAPVPAAAPSRWQLGRAASGASGRESTWMMKKRQRAEAHAARNAAGDAPTGPVVTTVVMCVHCNSSQPGGRCPFRLCRNCCPVTIDGVVCEQHQRP